MNESTEERRKRLVAEYLGVKPTSVPIHRRLTTPLIPKSLPLTNSNKANVLKEYKNGASVQLKKDSTAMAIPRNPDNKFEDFVPENGSVFLMSGKSRRGKSHMIKYLIMRLMIDEKVPVKDRVRYTIVFTSTKANGFYQKFLPDRYVVDGYDEKMLEAIYEKQAKIKASGREPPKILVVIEDAVGILDSNNKWFLHYITTARHYGISTVVAVQYILRNISTTFRASLDFAFLFGDKGENVRKAFYSCFGSIAGTFKQFDALFRETTKDPDLHSALLFVEADNNWPYFKYRAPAEFPNVRINY